jgi:hypothetical protein
MEESKALFCCSWWCVGRDRIGRGWYMFLESYSTASVENLKNISDLHF